jgi:hypothetical protein
MISRSLLAAALVFSLIIAPTHSANASECQGPGCISVTTDDESDEIVVTIQGSKSSRQVSTTPRTLPATSGSTSAISDPNRTWIPYHPDLFAAWREAARKAAQTRRNRPSVTRLREEPKQVSVSLADQVRELIPIGELRFQPGDGAIVNKPVYFWSTTPTKFQVTLRVAGVPVTIELTPQFNWNYGEGEIRSTSLPGAPYPIALNTFTYFSPGKKKIELETVWSGSFYVSGVKAPIKGVITQRRVKDLHVLMAPHRALS